MVNASMDIYIYSVIILPVSLANKYAINLDAISSNRFNVVTEKRMINCIRRKLKKTRIPKFWRQFRAFANVRPVQTIRICQRQLCWIRISDRKWNFSKEPNGLKKLDREFVKKKPWRHLATSLFRESNAGHLVIIQTPVTFFIMPAQNQIPQISTKRQALWYR